MSRLDDVRIDLFVKDKTFTNGGTGEVFTSTVFDGYVLFKDSPILRARGRKLEDKILYNKETGAPFTVKKLVLSLYDGEELDDDLKKDYTLFLKIYDKETRSGKEPFQTVETGDTYYGKEDPRNTAGFRLGNMILPLNGIIETKYVKDIWGDDARKLTLVANNEYSMGKITRDMVKKEGKVGYTIETSGDLFSDDDLAALKDQFKFYSKFKTAFDGGVVPATF